MTKHVRTLLYVLQLAVTRAKITTVIERTTQI